MGTQNSIRTANDNKPSVRDAKGTQHYPELSTPVSPHPHQTIIPKATAQKESFKLGSNPSLKLSLTSWAAAMVTMVIVFSLGLGTASKVFASLALLWVGLWNSYVSADSGHWRLSEISVITALCGLMGAITTTSNFFGLGLIFTDVLMLMSVLPLLAGYVLKSRICVLASICACLIWTALNFAGLIEASNIIMLFPFILAGQLYSATKIHSGMAITLAVITAYYWGLNFTLTSWNAGNLPLTFAMAALFIIGAAHHRGGKAAEDKRQTGSSIHIHTGWLAAVIGAIGFQYFWLSPDAVEISTASLSVNGLLVWKIAVALSLGVVFCSAIIRYKHSQISLAGIFLSTAASAIIPLMLWLPSWPQKIIGAVPGTSMIPTIGVFIGATITAAAIGMTLNGVRRNSSLMMGMGLTVLFAEAYLLIKPELATLDNAVIFVTGLLTALAISGVIAGSSLAHQAPAPRMKHN